MIRHYVTTAFLNMRMAPFTTAAKIITLALGLLAMIAATGVIAYWRSADSTITPRGGRVVMITTGIRMFEEKLNLQGLPVTASHVAKYMREDIPGLEQVAYTEELGDVRVDTGEHKTILSGLTAEPGFFDIFHLNFAAGDARTAMQQQDSVLLTEDAAKRLFGEAPALGRHLLLGGQRHVTVTGVLAEIPQPSILPAFDYISVRRPPAPGFEGWGTVGGPTYALLPADGSLSRAELNRRLADMVARRVPAEDKAGYSLTLTALPLNRFMEVVTNLEVMGSGGGLIDITSALLGLAALVLGVACLNYANLSTAQAAARAKEIGLRRVLGAGRIGILVQSWIEAGLATVLAATLSLSLLWAAGKLIAAQNEVNIITSLASEPAMLGKIALIAALATLAAGLYPAFMVSRVRPVEALRTGMTRGGSRLLAKVLIGIQFTVASGLLIAVIVVGQQNAYMRGLALHVGADPVILLPPELKSGITVNTLRQQLSGYPQIRAVSQTAFEPWGSDELVTRLARTPQGAETAEGVSNMAVGMGYFEVFDQKVLAGRVPTEARDQPGAGSTSQVRLSERPSGGGDGEPAPGTADLERMVIDRAFSERMGFASPQAAVGQILYDAAHAPQEIMGVVETRTQRFKTLGKGGMVYYLGGGNTDFTPVVRIDANDVDGALAIIRRVWDQSAVGGPLEYQFEDEAFETAFQTHKSVGLMFLMLSVLAFAISAVGLFGMAVHTTQRRTHEIGVRKTLGSSVPAVVGLLLGEFSRPVIIANLIAWPAGYLAAQAYLSTFTQHITVTPWPFLLSLVITLSIAWLAVGGQTLKAASVRPAQVLRDA